MLAVSAHVWSGLPLPLPPQGARGSIERHTRVRQYGSCQTWLRDRTSPWWIRRARRAPTQCAAPECSVLLFVRAVDRRSAAARRALVSRELVLLIHTPHHTIIRWSAAPPPLPPTASPRRAVPAVPPEHIQRTMPRTPLPAHAMEAPPRPHPPLAAAAGRPHRHLARSPRPYSPQPHLPHLPHSERCCRRPPRPRTAPRRYHHLHHAAECDSACRRSRL